MNRQKFSFLKVLKDYGPASRLRDEEVQEIIRKLRHLKTDVYAVTRREVTQEEITMHLDFIRHDAGI